MADVNEEERREKGVSLRIFLHLLHRSVSIDVKRKNRERRETSHRRIEQTERWPGYLSDKRKEKGEKRFL